MAKENVIRVVHTLNDIPGFPNLLNNIESCDNSLKLNKIEYTTNRNQFYKIIRYDKSVLTKDMTTCLGLLRSVVVNSENNVVCFAPPKMMDADTFFSQGDSRDYQAEEFVEGTMINVFWDETAGLCGSWEIATRNSIAGESSLYTSKNSTRFRTMFLEATSACNLDLNKLEKRFSYSFVLQHPENTIVTLFSKPALYLIEVYEIVNTEDGTVNVFLNDLETFEESAEFKNTTIKFPEIYQNWNTVEDLKNKYASMNTSYNKMGVVIRNKSTQTRTKFRNPVFENCKKIRGTDAKYQYLYLVMRKQDAVKEFLEQFPSFRKEYAACRQQLHNFTGQLYTNYISCYIRKEQPLVDFPIEYKTHMYHLHRHFIDVLKPAGEYINKTEVIRYINGLEPDKIIYSLNEPMRKRHVDNVKVLHEENS